MAKLTPLLGLPLSMAMAACLDATPAESTSQSQPGAVVVAAELPPVVLPLEVLGPANTRRFVRFNLDSAAAARVKTLEIQCHGCGYRDHASNLDADSVKATVIVNGVRTPLRYYTYLDPTSEEPVTLAAENVLPNGTRQRALTMLEPDGKFGGIGGALRTVRFRLHLSADLAQGINTIAFEHTNPDRVSTGFRILALTLRAGDGRAVTPTTPFVHDDPATWQPIHQGLAARARGKALWERRNSLYDPYADSLDGTITGFQPRTPGDTNLLSGKIVASCADCHERNGADLKYFNFSNDSIVARSVFHGLTGQEGREIASYIRSLPDARSIEGRPWNPPYQPGPGLDARAPSEWAAGAGINAVLSDAEGVDADARMDAHLFPGGHLRSAVRAVVDRFGTLNYRETPIALQMPDWNAWLPHIHPIDAFDTSAPAISSNEDGKPVGRPFFAVLYEAAEADPTPENIDAIMTRSTKWLSLGADCESRAKPSLEDQRGSTRFISGPHVRAVNGDVLSKLRLPSPPARHVVAHPTTDEANWDKQCTLLTMRPVPMHSVELAKQGLLAWSMVKQWELVHGRGLETSASALPSIRVADRMVSVKEARGWPVRDRTAFDRAPHMSGHDSMTFVHLDLLASLYETSAWYHLQTILQPGYRQTMPAHFPYSILYVSNLSRMSRVPLGYQYFLTYIKMRQQQTNGRYGVEEGLDLRTAQPFWIFSDIWGDSFTQASLGAHDPALWSNVAEALIDDMVEDASHVDATKHPNAWDLAKTNSVVQKHDDPLAVCPAVEPPLLYDAPGASQGDNTFRVIPELRSIGVRERTLDRLIDWSKQMWPGPNGQNLSHWERRRAGATPTPCPPRP